MALVLSPYTDNAFEPKDISLDITLTQIDVTATY